MNEEIRIFQGMGFSDDGFGNFCYVFDSPAEAEEFAQKFKDEVSEHPYDSCAVYLGDNYSEEYEP
jgi:hypothetical protein